MGGQDVREYKLPTGPMSDKQPPCKPKTRVMSRDDPIQADVVDEQLARAARFDAEGQRLEAFQ